MSASQGSLSLVDQLDVVVVPTDIINPDLDDEGTSSVTVTVSVTASLTKSYTRTYMDY
jgi:hypothetical protein